jgi:hypothetical protein
VPLEMVLLLLIVQLVLELLQLPVHFVLMERSLLLLEVVLLRVFPVLLVLQLVDLLAHGNVQLVLHLLNLEPMLLPQHV